MRCLAVVRQGAPPLESPIQQPGRADAKLTDRWLIWAIREHLKLPPMRMRRLQQQQIADSAESLLPSLAFALHIACSVPCVSKKSCASEPVGSSQPLVFLFDTSAFTLSKARLSRSKYVLGCNCKRGGAEARVQVLSFPPSFRSIGYPVLSVRENRSKKRRGPMPMNGMNGSLLGDSSSIEIASP